MSNLDSSTIPLPPASKGAGQKAAEDPKIRQSLGAFRNVFYIAGAFGALTLGFYTIFYLQYRIPQVWLAFIPIGIALAIAPIAYSIASWGKTTLAALLVLLAVGAAYGGNELAWSGLIYFHIFGGTLLMLMVAFMLLPRRYILWGISIGIYWLYLFGVRLIPGLLRQDAMVFIELIAYAVTSDMLMVMAALVLFFQWWQRNSIRGRILTIFLSLVLLPFLAISTISSIISIRSTQDQVYKQLSAVINFRQAMVTNWLNSTEPTLGSSLPDASSYWLLRTVFDATATDDPIFQSAQGQLRLRFDNTIKQSKLFDEIFLLNMEGKVVVSTDLTQEQQILASRSYFTNGLTGFNIDPPALSPELGVTSVIVSIPVVDTDNKVAGVLAGRLALENLNAMFIDRAGLGNTGETFIVDSNYRLLTESRYKTQGWAVGKPVFSESITNLIEKHQDGSGVYVNYRGMRVLGVYQWIPSLGAGILAEQTQSEAAAPIIASLLYNALAALIALVIAVVASFYATQRITKPIGSLSETAIQVAAGNLNLLASVEEENEIGALAHAFNSMTAQLRSMVSNLEQRVAQRTEELQQRSLQLRVAAEVARDTAAIHDLNELLNKAVGLITKRFDFYHSAIFLLDDQGEYAILKAATGQAGVEMVASELKLKVGSTGMIGYVAQNGKPRIASDVNLELDYLRHPLLPDTHSEMAIPLKVGDRIIGVLDVQTNQEKTLQEDDAPILQTVSDQLAVAIESARLFQEMNQTLMQLEAAQSQYTQEAWRIYTQRIGRLFGYRYRGLGVEAAMKETPEVMAAYQQGELVITGMDSDQYQLATAGRTSVAVPLKMRDYVLGVVNLKFSSPNISNEALETLREVANRLSLSLESARLLEETQMRTEQLHLLQEITAAASAHIHIQELLDDVTQRILSGFNLQHCQVGLFNSEKSTSTVVSEAAESRENNTSDAGTRLMLNQEPVIQEVLKIRKSMVIRNLPDQPFSDASRAMVERHGTGSLLIAPLFSRNEVIGTIWLEASDPERVFTADDISLIDQIAIQISTAIEVARFLQQTEKRAEQERQITEITSKVRESTNIEIILQTALRELSETLHVTKGSIQLRSGNGGNSND